MLRRRAARTGWSSQTFLFVCARKLTLHLAPHWGGQNWLDVVVVGMSILDLTYGAVPSWLVRLMRALRVVRLFGRVRELRKVSAAVVYEIIISFHGRALVARLKPPAPPFPLSFRREIVRPNAPTPQFPVSWRRLRKASAAVVYSRRLRVSKVVSPRCAR